MPNAIMLRPLAFLGCSLLLLGPPVAYVQECPDELLGAWTGALAVDALLTVRVTVIERAPGRYVAEIRSQERSEEVPVWMDGERLRFQSAGLPVAFDGTLSDDGTRIGGFVQHASHIIRVELVEQDGAGARTWVTDWTPLGVREESVRFDLYVDDGAGGIGGYFFFRDQRLPGLWGYGAECREERIIFRERNLGLSFEGRLDAVREILSLTVSGMGGSVPITFERMPQDAVPSVPDAPETPARQPAHATYAERAPEVLQDGWPTAMPSELGLDVGVIREMVRAVVEEEMALTHSVLVARHGTLVVEEYFYGFDRDTWHDMRSASKTVTSTLIGLAVQEGSLEGSGATALQYFPKYRRYANWDERKAEITIRDLLTMSSGLDANDSDPNSVAAEGAYQSQMRQPDWIKLALDAPMIAEPGSQPLYGGANPLILGGIIAEVVEEPVEWFAHRTLLGPLGIEHYKFFMDPTGVVYMGGGLHLRPRDMAKYGQLYLAGGIWRGRRILSEEWIRESWGKYGRLAPLDRNGHQYGYLWWHHRYQVGDRIIETVEARGMGGQYIFVVPSLELVAVITSGNYRTGKTRQPEEILRRFILPAALSAPSAR